jgi:hypothetical protein
LIFVFFEQRGKFLAAEKFAILPGASQALFARGFACRVRAVFRVL